MRSTHRIRLVAVLAAVVALFLTLLPSPAFADHQSNTLEVNPESQTHVAGETATLSASLGSPLTLLGPNIDFEIESGPGDPDGNTPKTPDMTCSPLIGLLGCSVSYSSSKRGVDTVRAWLDEDGSDTTNEYDNDEFPNEAAAPGHPEPDITDVVLVMWNQGPPAKIDCDDSNFDDQETNFSGTGAGSDETYTCRAFDAGGVLMADIAIDGENLSTTGVNDPENPTVDYKDFCVTGETGSCSGTIESQGKKGTTDICFWADGDRDDVYDPNAENEQFDGSDCDGELYNEAENNDVTDVVQITWIAETVKPISQLLRPVHNGVYLDTSLDRFTATATDAHSEVAKVEIALRRHRKDGKCAIWKGTGWSVSSCQSQFWLAATRELDATGQPTDNWTYVLPEGRRLSESTSNASGIAFYWAFSRATDSEGNVEVALETGRNRNRFDIRRA